MIACEIQLQYVIPDKFQSETKFNLRKNLRKRFFVGKNFVRKYTVQKELSQTLSLISSALFELSRTNGCLSSLSRKYIPQQLNMHTACHTCKIHKIDIFVQIGEIQ